ncbi:hypothetical protein P5F71_08330 [Clostridium perfringens]|nr:hypothetical protein [Clostridium perfringens]
MNLLELLNSDKNFGLGFFSMVSNGEKEEFKIIIKEYSDIIDEVVKGEGIEVASSHLSNNGNYMLVMSFYFLEKKYYEIFSDLLEKKDINLLNLLNEEEYIEICFINEQMNIQQIIKIDNPYRKTLNEVIFYVERIEKDNKNLEKIVEYINLNTNNSKELHDFLKRSGKGE